MTYMPLDLRSLHSGAPRDRPASDGLDIDAARQLILADLVSLNEAEQVPVGAVIGRIAADDVVSPVALPRFDNSAMDGYALHTTDLDATGLLLIGGQVQAGQGDLPAMRRGTVVRVTTGAAIPVGTAAVVPDEDIDLRPGASIRVRPAGASGGSGGPEYKRQPAKS